MAISVVMPALELTQETGKLVSWCKKEGEAVAKGETLMEVETDKAVVEVEAQADGFLAGVNAKDGEVIAVGTTIAWIVAKGEAPPQSESTLTVTSGATISTKIAQPEKAKAASPGDLVSRGKPKISPKARRIAGELQRRSEQRARLGPGRRDSPVGRRSCCESPITHSRSAFRRSRKARNLHDNRQIDGRAHSAKLDNCAAFLPGA